MIVGVPRGIKVGEQRVALTPAAAPASAVVEVAGGVAPTEHAALFET